ncbi:DUF814 domain-containing protein [Candidatus Micrarchaeota archaeon]|nr:DUF814 domain-containing protein [Candidatus Micrarchaeota archaeon]
MKIFFNKTVHENAAYYYELAKKTREKIRGLQEAIEETKKEMKKAEKIQKKEVRIKKQKEWFEKFHHSYTSSGMLMIGGRNAQQNDMVVSKYMEDSDLFFHADIQGGSVVVLKGGTNATDSELEEAAQFAASFSKAWANANAGVDVYAVKKEQLSKKEAGGFVPTGAFAIHGERKWFKNTRLALKIGISSAGLSLFPEKTQQKLQKPLILVPAKTGKEKGSLAKSLAKRYSAHPDDFLEILPNGKSRTISE